MLNPVLPAVPEKRRPALRLIKTNDLPREDWLDVRQHGIGSSDAAAAIGRRYKGTPVHISATAVCHNVHKVL